MNRQVERGSSCDCRCRCCCLSSIERLQEEQRHKVKMKSRSEIGKKLLTLLMAVVVIQVAFCDVGQSQQLAAVSRQQPLADAGHLLDDDADHRPNPYAGNSLDLPRFEQSKQVLVVGSAWQNVVFLPCKIANLNEEQHTVSSI